MPEKPHVVMFGPHLDTTSGISNVVNNWIEAGIRDAVRLNYISTLTDYVPGQYVRKIIDALSAFVKFALLSREHIDIAHIHVSTGMSFYRKLAVFLIARLKGAKTIVHLHGSSFKEFYTASPPPAKRLIGLLFDRSTAVIVLGKAWGEFIGSISQNERIHILYNGASKGKFDGKLATPGRLNIAFMGRLGERKGIYDLLEAFKRLAAVVPEAHLALGGDGEVGRVRLWVESERLEDRIDVLGWVSGDDKIDVFRRADIYVLPSYREGLPGSILEAMAASLPVVSTPVGSIAEAVVDGRNGFLVNPGDVDGLYSKLLLLCRDEALRRDMGRESSSILGERFDIAEILNKLIKIYASQTDSNVQP